MKLKKPIAFAARLAITLAAGYLAFSQVHFREVMPLLTSLPPLTLLAALVLVHIAQSLGALRTRYYLQCENIPMPVGPSLQLQYIGGLFNAFLPGGAGGDVYKAWWLKRYKQGNMLNMVKVMLAGRLNGLWALGVLICLTALASGPIRALHPYAPEMLVALAIAGSIAYMLLAKFAFKEVLSQQWRAGAYSLILQLCLLALAFLVAHGLGHGADAIEYSTLFLLSCILAMMPISIGGIGVRELAVLQGSRLLHLQEDTGVTIAFTFTLLSLTVPLIGAALYHRTPHEKALTA